MLIAMMKLVLSHVSSKDINRVISLINVMSNFPYLSVVFPKIRQFSFVDVCRDSGKQQAASLNMIFIV